MESAWVKSIGRKFALQFRVNKLATGGETKTPYYELTKTECLYIATKFNDEARARLILRWEELEKERLTAPALPEKAEASPRPADKALADGGLTELADGKAVTTSRKLAAVLGREHHSVLRTINDNLHKRGFKYGHFTRRDYSTGICGHGYEYLITRKGLAALAGAMRRDAKGAITEAYRGVWNVQQPQQEQPGQSELPFPDEKADDTAEAVPVVAVDTHVPLSDSVKDYTETLEELVASLGRKLRGLKGDRDLYVKLYARERDRADSYSRRSGLLHDLYQDLMFNVVKGCDGTLAERLERHLKFRGRISRVKND